MSFDWFFIVQRARVAMNDRIVWDKSNALQNVHSFNWLSYVTNWITMRFCFDCNWVTFKCFRVHSVIVIYDSVEVHFHLILALYAMTLSSIKNIKKNFKRLSELLISRFFYGERNMRKDKRFFLSLWRIIFFACTKKLSIYVLCTKINKESLNFSRNFYKTSKSCA